MEYYLDLRKKKEILEHAVTWMNFEGIMLSKMIGQILKYSSDSTNIMEITKFHTDTKKNGDSFTRREEMGSCLLESFSSAM